MALQAFAIFLGGSVAGQYCCSTDWYFIMSFCNMLWAGLKISKVMQTIFGSALVTFAGMVLAALFAGLNMDSMTIGGSGNTCSRGCR